MIWMILGGAAALGVIAWLGVRGRRSPARTTQALRRRLLRLTNDASVVERLIAAERERHPKLAEIALLRRAIRRLERDRRR